MRNGEAMTCIVASIRDGKIYMGGDSAAVSGWDIQQIANPKVFIRKDIIIGYTSSFRMGQLLQYVLDIPENNDGDDLYFLVSKFIPAVRGCLKDGGYTKIDNNREASGTFILGYRGTLYEVADDFQVAKVIAPFMAIGAGKFYALGAMAAFSPTIRPKDAILRSLEIAGNFSGAVCAPYYVQVLS